MTTSMPNLIAHKERHKTGAQSGTLRAAVFGVNDGLVSSLSLVMGIAGANTQSKFVLLTVGSALSFVTGKSSIFSGLRMLSIGGLAAAVTYLVGYLLGVSIGT